MKIENHGFSRDASGNLPQLRFNKTDWRNIGTYIQTGVNHIQWYSTYIQSRRMVLPLIGLLLRLRGKYLETSSHAFSPAYEFFNMKARERRVDMKKKMNYVQDLN